MWRRKCIPGICSGGIKVFVSVVCGTYFFYILGDESLFDFTIANGFSHYVGWQQEKKLSDRKNISSMIEIYQGEITGFVNKTKFLR